MILRSTATPPSPVPSVIVHSNATELPVVRTYDVTGLHGWLATKLDPVRTADEPPTGDKAIDDAHENARVTLDFFRQVLGRNSIDGKGSPVVNFVHDEITPMNATWSSGAMTYGDGDGRLFGPMSGALDVVAHEMSHGVVEHTAGLQYQGQPGALNESFADVFGEIAQQWHEDPAGFGTVDAARGAEWLIGEDAVLPAFGGAAMRNMARPGTAFKNDTFGADPQVGSMHDFVRTSADFGGVHTNSGIPNRAAYEAAIQIGSEKVAKIWYDALGSLTPRATFSDAAHAIVASAGKLYDSGVSSAVADAWKAVEVLD